MENYNKSFIAKNGSKITKSQIGDKTTNKASFFKGFISGFLSSVLAGLILHFLLS